MYHSFWIFDRYMHHCSAAAGDLRWLFNDSQKMYCIQSPCKDGEWKNAFCRAMAELLNYLFNWEGGKNQFLGFKKLFMDQCENVLAKKNRFFFSLGSWKEKKGAYSQCANHFRACYSVCNCFSMSAASILTPCGLILVASSQYVMLSITIESLMSEISLLPAFSLSSSSMFYICVINCSDPVRCSEVLKNFKIYAHL